jgi:hypothetical protein
MLLFAWASLLGSSQIVSVEIVLKYQLWVLALLAHRISQQAFFSNLAIFPAGKIFQSENGLQSIVAIP